MIKMLMVKLFTLLSGCKPDEAKIRKRVLITEILEMPEYKALQMYQGAASIMNDYYSPQKLQESTYKQLQEVKKLLPFMEECIRMLYETICYGDVWQLKCLKKIDFYNAKSMDRLYQLVLRQEQTGINITNISECDVWKIFSPKAILSVESRMDWIDLEDTRVLEILVAEKLRGEIYCISEAEIVEKGEVYRRAYSDICKKEETINKKLQIVEKKVFVKKLLWSFISVCMIMSQFSGSVVLFSNIGRVIALIIYIFVLVVYWIWG